MQHRLCSPSETYATMPATPRGRVNRKANCCNDNSTLKANSSTRKKKLATDSQRQAANDFPIRNTPPGEGPVQGSRPHDLHPSSKQVVPNSPNSGENNKKKLSLPISKDKISRMKNTSKQAVTYTSANSSNELELSKPSTSGNKSVMDVQGDKSRESLDTKRNEEPTVILISDSDSDSDLDSDSDSDLDFFKKFPRTRKSEIERLPYTAEEDEQILKYVLSGGNVLRTGSLLLWKELESKKTSPRRTYQSLKNRFLRNIKPLLLTKFRYMLDSSTVKLLKKRFPELISEANNQSAAVKKYHALNICEKRSVPLQRLTEKVTSARSFAGLEVTNSPKREKVSGANSARGDACATRSFNDAALDENGRTLPDAKESVSLKEPAQENGRRGMILNSFPNSSHPEGIVHIYAREKLENVPFQTFKYYENIKPFRSEVALNLKLLLFRDVNETDSSPIDMPVSVSVTVSVGKEGEQDASHKKPSNSKKKVGRKNLPVKEPLWKKRSVSKRSYLLGVKSKNDKKFKRALPWYLRAVSVLVKKIEEEKKEEERRTNQEENSEIHSDALCGVSQSAEAVSMNSNTQKDFSLLTNCSTEDESRFTQTMNRVSRNFRVKLRQTPDVSSSPGAQELG